MTNTHIIGEEIWIKRDNIAQCATHPLNIDLSELESGDAVLKVDIFGFSANNITYAMLGEKMAYWGFFPAPETWGIVPVWGFATVVASKHDELSVGEKVFGYLPMATHLKIRPAKVTQSNFYDANPARKSISPVYDNYVRCAHDPAYDPNREAWQLNYRPLFMTSFVLDDYVGENLGEVQQNILLSSASSKTAYGTAHLLMKHKAERGGNYQVIGLTSVSNKAFVQSLGCYDQVLNYDEIGSLEQDKKACLLDFAGNKQLILDLQTHYQQTALNLIFIGATDVQAQVDKPSGDLDGELFFAPSQVKKRSGEWGQAGFAQRYAQAWSSFAKVAEGKVNVAHYSGAEAIQKVYKLALANKLDNQDINVLSF